MRSFFSHSSKHFECSSGLWSLSHSGSCVSFRELLDLIRIFWYLNWCLEIITHLMLHEPQRDPEPIFNSHCCNVYWYVCLQENLLQSVLPVYISMKMKLAIMERLQECKDKEERQRLVKDNNFHSLYVKRHENVRYKHKQPKILVCLFFLLIVFKVSLFIIIKIIKQTRCARGKQE